MNIYDNEDYRRTYRQVEEDVWWTGKRLLWRIVLALIILGAIGFGMKLLFTPVALVEKATDPDKIISNYEEFQEIYNTCQKIDADLKTICVTADNDPMFAQFSKGAMVAQKRQAMTRWVNEYNAKSKMITRQYWKSGTLPYQLSAESFPNYNCNTGGAK